MSTQPFDDRAPWTPTERALIDALLDVILPASADGKLPAGSALPVAEFLAARIAETAALGKLLRTVLRKAEALATTHGSITHALVTQLEQTEPVLFQTFVRHAFMGYYTHPSIPLRLGLPDRPPQPLGHKVPRDTAGELDELLAPVRARGKHYRDAG